MFGLGLSSSVPILRSYSTTVLRFINIRSSCKKEWHFQEIQTNQRADRVVKYNPKKRCCQGYKIDKAMTKALRPYWMKQSN